jgi:hypothetical protein
MPVVWSKGKKNCEEFECTAKLTRGHRHHCRYCGKSICDRHSHFANHPSFSNKFSHKKKSKIGSFFYKKRTKIGNVKRNTRICTTCSIRYNFVRTPVTKRFSKLVKAEEWIRENFKISTHHSQDEDVMLYNGITFKGDDWKDYTYFFKNGFKQRSDDQDFLNGLHDFDNFSGKNFAGHTSGHGISTSTSFVYAHKWRKEVYALDLSYHPYAVDINKSFKETMVFNNQGIGSKPQNPEEAYEFQFEINVANAISPHMVIGVYLGKRRKFIHNPNYDPDYGNY